MSCSGVGLTAVANIGFVLVCTIPSKMLAPGSHYLIEVLEDNLTPFAPQPRRAIEFEFHFDIEIVRRQPIFAFRISLDGMNMHWLIPFVGIEVKPPSPDVENSGH